MAIKYFENFESMFYNFDIKGVRTLMVVKDITENVRVRKFILDNITAFDDYIITDDESPEIISEKVYGTPYYHWVIMMVNQRYDYVADFPLSNNNLYKFITQKYGVGAENLIHHWETEQGYIVDSDFPGAVSVSNLQHEERVNESKRQIKIINRTLLPRILQQIESLL